MVYLLLNFIAAERESNWPMHLETFCELLQYDHAFDHYKYFVWRTIYPIDMDDLSTRHPQLHENYMLGYHTVSRLDKELKFNCVSTDMALEQSMNRDSKTKNGIIGVTQDNAAVEKWLTAHLRAACHSNFRDVCGVLVTDQEKELTAKTIVNSEKAVKAISTLKEQCANPFYFSATDRTPLENIFTGSVMPEENRNDILNAKSIGKKAAVDFLNERIVERSIRFADPIKKLMLKRQAANNM